MQITTPSQDRAKDLRPSFREGVRGRLALPADGLDALVGNGSPVGSDRWWDAVSGLGTPVRTPGPDETDVTLFLFRSADAGAVYVDVQPFTDRSRLADGLMERVPGTDVWWAAFATGPGWISAYGFLPLDEVPVAPAERNTDAARSWWLGLLERSVPDPLNPDPSFRGMRGDVRSVARGPRAPRAVERGADDARGTLDLHVWHRSRVADYPVWTYVAPGAEAGAPGGAGLPLVVLHDGQVWERLDVAATLDALVARGALPPFVAVLVSSLDQASRTRDLPGSTAYYDAVADGLLPQVAERLAARGVRVTSDPARTVVAGQSFGGLAALQAVRHRPDRFGLALGQSASLWWPGLDDPASRDVAAWLRSAPARDERVVLQVGAHEGDLTAANREVRDLLVARGEHVDYAEVDGGHDWAWWSACLGDGLVTLLGSDGGQ